ncbi:GNAT family N-acetyltransferase [Vibrio gangliei]|uniref:GNAT family N-acetyltransferase n=1 Tax=Vibrio gangliei TaxID=2077090 RepID=UPI000D0188C1|nr:GNAT family N-acetyltransferase [Vibrio gangliei]
MQVLQSLNDLASHLAQSHHRYAVKLTLGQSDLIHLLEQFSVQQAFEASEITWLGGEQASIESQFYSFKQGHQLLGRETKMLIVDLSVGFDANSFNAALGTLVGGGILFVLNADALNHSHASDWLIRQFQAWPQIVSLDQDLNWHLDEKVDSFNVQYHQQHNSQQHRAIEAIEKVMTGHRRRPLVMNANRGRGKTASLGMAAAKLMSQRVINIFVTAPSITALSPLFDFLERGVGELTWQSQQRTHWVLENGSQIRFISPDELYLNHIDADLLMVDEAAALPLPMLTHFVEHYHRMVLSSTIHGYEGCGRGFTLKFMSWLNQHRPGWKLLELTQPIRWAENDPLEAWSFDAFLLHSDVSNVAESSASIPFSATDIQSDNISLSLVDKHQLVTKPQLYASIFGLLVSAHYQTSPNDVLQVLDSDEIQIYQVKAIMNDGYSLLLGCLLVSFEGGLSPELITDIQIGKRRPKGHLAASHLANHLAWFEPAEQTSARIMRIAIHPEWQSKGIGTRTLTLLAELLSGEVDFLSVSFGATAELVSFWKSEFQFVALGTRRDHVSGCYSAFMVKPLSESSKDWIKSAHRTCLSSFQTVLPLQYPSIEHGSLAALLLEHSDSDEFVLPAILRNYAQGGNSFETALPIFQAFMFQYLSYHAAARYQLQESQLPVVIDKVMLFLPWQTVANKYQLAGRKQIEQSLKQWLLQFTV